MQRRLAAIVSADVVGYSRLVEADEEAAIQTLKMLREAIDRLVAGHHGRVFGGAGDSVVAEFASPVEAVRCAVAIQQDVEQRNAAALAVGVFPFRGKKTGSAWENWSDRVTLAPSDERGRKT